MMEETQSSNRNLILVLALGALLFALLVVVVAVVFVMGGGDSEEGAVAAASAKLMPPDTFMFMSFNPHLDQAKNFEVLDQAWGNSPMIQEGLTEILAGMQQEGLDYQTDIEPWLGNEIGFSIGSNLLTSMSTEIEGVFEEIEESLTNPGYVPEPDQPSEIPQMTIAIATKDRAASDKFLDKLRAEGEESGEAFQETEYQGIKIVYQEAEMAYATVDDFIVLTAGGPEPLKAAIDAWDSTDNLSENQNYKDVLAELPSEQIGYGYMDLGAYMEIMLEAAGPEMAQLPPELFNPEQLKAVKGMGFSVGLEPNGMRMDFVATYDSDAMPENMLSTQTTPNKAAGRVPAGTLFYMSGSGLGNGIQMALDAIKAMPDQPPDLDEQMQMLTSMLGVSVEELIEMMSGEFALSIAHDPAGLGGDPKTPIGISFLIEAKDQEKFEKLIRSVGALLKMGGEMELPTQTINDVEVSTFPDPYTGNMVVGWGVGQGFFAIGTSEELLTDAFGGDGDKLADDATYKAATELLPKDKSGIFYLNMDGLMDIVVENMSDWERESFEEQGRDMLAPIKAFSAASEPYKKGQDSASGTFFILIESE